MMNELEDRLPTSQGPDFVEPKIEDSSLPTEHNKEIMEMIEMIDSLNRRQRRKIIKPSFSNTVKKTFRKKMP